ncbi:Uncharacterised protein [Mycobacteroides abscessus subsp. abscessus]|nr:Uncharacterised protein [Mycobacteroides abscessus subsp. abscessus]
MGAVQVADAASAPACGQVLTDRSWAVAVPITARSPSGPATVTPVSPLYRRKP